MTGQEVFPDLAPHQGDDAIVDEIYGCLTEQEYPDISYPCFSIVQRCWRDGHASAEQVLTDLKALETKTGL